MDLRLLPCDELPVVPDILRRLKRHFFSFTLRIQDFSRQSPMDKQLYGVHSCPRIKSSVRQ
jgi:hypothetical protein